MEQTEATMKTHYKVRLRRIDTGEEQTRDVVTDSETRAKALAIEKARSRLQAMADRHYAQFEVLAVEQGVKT